MNLLETIITLMSDQGCGIFPIQEVNGEKRLYELGFDSLRYMEFVVLLEETFEIEMPDELLEINSNTKVKDIILGIKSCLNTP